mmetsp:Transcript_19378/g.31183  ORF Transcript_19378/g.31183 Transcript_19378/m.31183 type:complete len:380 (+) Transcript_19378:91-1230(+)
MPREVKSSSESGALSTIDWNKSIISILENFGATDDARKVKKLRKLVLLSLQLDESDKTAKKQFKKAIQGMEEEGTVRLDADGTISMLKTPTESNSNKKKRKLSKEEKKSKKKRKEKRQKTEEETENGHVSSKKTKKSDTSDDDADENETDEKEQQTDKIDGSTDASDVEEPSKKNKSCKGNPQGVTRLFLGNLPFAVDESSLSAFLPGEVTHIKWITDKETGKFYGSAFVEMDNSISAAEAVAMAGSKLIGRPIKINFAPAREGDTWPPPKKVVSGGTAPGGGGQAGGTGIKAMSPKPDNCTKLFIGNLSYEIDDDAITKFFASVDAELKAVRWLHHRDSGDFKGVGFVEFWNTEACEKAASLNGKNLLGRPIRIDWTD